MSSNRSSTAVIFAAAVVAGCGLESSLVGGRCAPGLSLVGNECVPPSPTLITPTDPAEEPIVSVSGSVDGSAPRPVSPPFVEPPAPFPFDPAQPIVPLVPEEDASVPDLECIVPLVACRGECIPVDTDPLNCGACGKICPSNICVAGECQGATPGDVVLIGHDFIGASSVTAQAKVIANALSIPTTDPIRVLSFDGNAPLSAIEATEDLAVTGIKGRKVRITRAASASSLTSSTLSQRYDVVLIHDAGSGDPAARGASWSTSLGTFALKGGVVVAVDDGTSPLPQLLSSAGLLTVASHAVLPLGTHLVVAAPADVIGAQVLSPYATTNAPVAFQGVTAESADVRWVVRQSDVLGAGDPVVVHRVVR